MVSQSAQHRGHDRHPPPRQRPGGQLGRGPRAGQHFGDGGKRLAIRSGSAGRCDLKDSLRGIAAAGDELRCSRGRRGLPRTPRPPLPAQRRPRTAMEAPAVPTAAPMAAPMAVQWRSASTRRWEIKPEINWQSVIRPHHPPRRNAPPMPPFSDFRTGTGNPLETRATQNPAPCRLVLRRARPWPRQVRSWRKTSPPPPGTTLRWINSRVFQLTYDTRALGGGGSTGVELWGTRDGGKTWQSFGADAKGQSPMLVTVPEEGIYGFQMKLLAGGPAGRPPLSGEAAAVLDRRRSNPANGRITQARQGAGP